MELKRLTKRPTAVLFDAVGTLIHPQPSVAAAYQTVAARHGLDHDLPTIKTRFKEACRLFSVEQFSKVDPSHTPGQTSEANERNRWRAIVDHVLESPQSVQQTVFADLWEYFALAENWELDANVPELFKRLRCDGFRIGVASNFDGRLGPLLKHFLPDVELEVFISSEIGWAKPASGFYREVARRLDIEPSSILLVGDDYENDVAGPIQAGWQAIFLSVDSTAHFDAIKIDSLPKVADIVHHASG